MEAHELLACSTFHQGAAARAVGYAERGLALYDEGGDHTYLAPFGEHPAVSCHYWAALALWFLGRPDSALAHGEQALALAAAHPYSLASAEVQLAYLHQYRGEPSETLRLGGAGPGDRDRARLPHPRRPGGHPRRLGPGRDRDRRRRRRRQLQAGLAGYLATGAELDHPYYLGLLAEAVAATAAGPVEGLAVVDEAIELVGTAGRSTTCPSSTASVATCWPGHGRRAAQAAEAYGRAMEIAAGYGTRSAELRAAIRLCRMPDRSTPVGARATLRGLYGQFDEGFGTPDLAARARSGPCAGR